MNDPAVISLIGAIAGLIAAVGGLFSAYAAFKSASTAKQASDRADQVELRQLARDTTTAGHRIVAETIRVDDLGKELSLEYDSLFAFSGGSGSGQLDLLKSEIEDKRRNSGELQQKVLAWLEGKSSRKQLSEEQLSAKLAELEGYLVHILRIKEKFERDLQSTRDHNRTYRERAINKSPHG